MMRLVILLLCAVALCVPVLAWYGSSYERIYERASYTESESGHSSSSGFHHVPASSDYSRTRSFDYEYELERESVNRGSGYWSDYVPYGYGHYGSDWGFSCSRGSKYRFFGC